VLVELLDRRLGIPELESKRGLSGAVLRRLLLPLKLLQSELLQQLLALAEHLSQFVAPSGVDVSQQHILPKSAEPKATRGKGKGRLDDRVK
jgi:hypothetical protein